MEEFDFETALEAIRKLKKLGHSANQDTWHVVGLPWNNYTPYINTKSEDPHIGEAIIDVIEKDCFEGESDEDIAQQEDEYNAQMLSNMHFVAHAGNCRCILKEIEFALELILSIKNGSVTEEMIAQGINVRDNPAIDGSCKFIFKAMSLQLMKEVYEATKKK